METQGLEILTNRFASWNNLVNATAVLEKPEVGSRYDCNWCNSGCGGCEGCGDGIYLPQKSPGVAVPEMGKIELRSDYSCQGCDGCDGCDGCE